MKFSFILKISMVLCELLLKYLFIKMCFVESPILRPKPGSNENKKLVDVT